ncbi:hypothetical protein M406DRAFT_71517 [Cryphonectria parasitica EP155]|uniref:Uncharacterized protein n=1 Tax=Cryphonectria parasitica (strain ATCC 38755 / EP155) TaxID=660469 RepID=A0A9P4Y8P0_CRYP1|nr:uncharacterized protein M406DRAFT_71517 [Cryphonectria parasitica EP155]KAF3768521.1 hypothetical protein M406DRAFT_71517 [Cryphonectria parasitica EP155]
MVYISEVDMYSSCARNEEPDKARDGGAMRHDAAASLTEKGEYDTAVDSLYPRSIGGGTSGNGSKRGSTQLIDPSLVEKEGYDTTTVRPLYLRGAGGGESRRNSKRSSTHHMDSSLSIMARAARQTDGRLEEPQQQNLGLDLQLELEGLDAALRRRSTRRSPRQDGPQGLEGQHEALGELATFLRDVTPPPSNYMSLPDPSTSSSTSSASSLRRRNSKGNNNKTKEKRRSMLKMALGLLTRRGSRRKAIKKRGGAVSPDLARAPSTRRRRPPRIKLPDTAVAGTTVDGFRHIAISIPIEHAHLGPEPRHRFGFPRRRSRSLSSPELSPEIYDDVTLRPRTAFATESRRGTQLGPLAEERESLSSTSWGKESSYRHGQAREEALAARRIRLASRNTFGTVYEKVRSVNTSPDLARPDMPLRMSSESSRHGTPRTSEELRSAARRDTLEALVKGVRASSNLPASRGPRPTSAYSFRSFASALPQQQRAYYHKRNSSLQPSEPGPQSRRPWTLSESMQYHSWDSSRDHTVRESIFSEQSQLDSIGTTESSEVPPSSAGAARTPRRLVGVDVVKGLSPGTRRSLDHKRASGSGRELEAGRGERSNWNVTARTNETNETEEDEQNHARMAHLNPESASVAVQEERVQEVDAAQQPGSTTVIDPEVLPHRPVKVTAEDILPSVTDREVNRQEDVHSAFTRSSETNTDPKGKGKATIQADDNQNEPGTVAATEHVESRGEEQGLGFTQQETQPAQQHEESLPSPVLNTQERQTERKSTLLSRMQRVAELRMVLEKPGAQPSDLLWKRRLSSSSDGSQDSVTPKASKADLEPAAVSAPVRPKTASQALSLTQVVTVADVAPSNQELLGRTSKESIVSSAPSLATLATVIRPSPALPYGSVTPPDSPPPSSPTSQLSFADADNASVLRRPIAPLKRINSYHFRRTASHASGGGRHSPVARRDASPPRPKTAGKGMLASKKSFFGRTAKTKLGQGSNGGAVASVSEEPSILKMTRSQMFQKYEALREKQIRDMERRVERLERNEDRLLSSLLPLLGDLQRTLGKMNIRKAGRKGERKEVDIGDRQSPSSRYHRNGIQSRFARRDTEEDLHRDAIYSHGDAGLDEDEIVVLHRQSLEQDRGTPERPRRLYLEDSDDNPSFTSDDHPSLPLQGLEDLDPRHRRWSRRATLLDPIVHSRQQDSSVSAPMLGKVRPNSMAVTSDFSLTRMPPICTDDIELDDRAAVRARNLAFEPSPSPDVRRNPPTVRDEQEADGARRLSTQSISSLETYDDTDASVGGPEEVVRRSPAREDDARPYRPGGSGMEMIEPLMRELQASGSPPSMESLGSGDIGDDEVRKLRERPGPRSVVGFGAFGEIIVAMTLR